MLLQLFHSPATPSTLFLNNVTSRPPPYRNYCTLLLGAEGLWDCGADLRLSFRVSDCEVWSWAVRPPQGKYPLASSFSFSDAFLGSRYDMYYSAPPHTGTIRYDPPAVQWFCNECSRVLEGRLECREGFDHNSEPPCLMYRYKRYIALPPSHGRCTHCGGDPRWRGPRPDWGSISKFDLCLSSIQC